MNEAAFVESREPDWKRLNLLAAKADASPVNLSPAELEEFVRLYKLASGDLAKVRTQSANVELIEFLNDLCAKAYGVLYRAPRANLLQSLAKGLRLSAQTVRRQAACVGFAAGLMVASAAFAFACMRFVPETKEHFIPPEWGDVFRNWREGTMEDRSVGENLGQTGFYLGNNPRAAITTGAVAASTFGVGSAYLVFFNGALLGALTAEMVPVGRVGYLFSLVMPHGVTELSGLVLSGAAGFAMAVALIRPGRRSRGDALRIAATDALTLLATSIVLMFIAAPIEGFFSFNPNVPIWAKIAFALVSAVAWAAFWLGYGREDAEGSVASDRGSPSRT